MTIKNLIHSKKNKDEISLFFLQEITNFDMVYVL